MPLRILATVFAAFLAAPAFGSQLWGVVVASNTTIELNPIDVGTGAVSPSTTSGSGLAFTAVLDLASDPVRQPNTIWAVRSSSAGNELIAVDPWNETLLSRQLMNAATPITSLAIDPTTGWLYGGSASALYQISMSTGQTTLIGQTPTPVPKGLGFDLDGNLFGIGGENVLVSVNKSTAATSVASTLNLYRMEDIAIGPEDGVMYGLGYAYTGHYSLFEIDVDTGALSNIGPSLVRNSGMAFTADQPPSGDLTGDLVVDAADYVVLRALESSSQAYTDWQSQFGQNAGGGASTAPVPEPTSLLPALFAACCASISNLAARRRGQKFARFWPRTLLG